MSCIRSCCCNSYSSTVLSCSGPDLHIPGRNHSRKKGCPDFGCPSQARLDRPREPGGIAGEKMPMNIDELSVSRSQLFDKTVHPVKIGAGNSRVHIQKIA